MYLWYIYTNNEKSCGQCRATLRDNVRIVINLCRATLRDRFHCSCKYPFKAGLPDGKNPNLDKFWRILQRKMLVYLFMVIRSILKPFGKV
jgi:hypothetical protein